MYSLGIVMITGDFTLLKYIALLNAADLERTIGFDKDRLKSGFRILALAGDETIFPEDFLLKGSTRWSGGLIKSLASQGQGLDINNILLSRGQDVAVLKKRVAYFFAQRGGNTPAKVVPNLRHTKSMKYPDAEALRPGFQSGIPQFSLLTARRFIVVKQE